jgi:hypothetical protein
MVVGRKNHYGSKSQRSTKVAALFYSLIETAKLRGEDPGDYLLRAALATKVTHHRHGGAVGALGAREDPAQPQGPQGVLHQGPSGLGGVPLALEGR